MTILAVVSEVGPTEGALFSEYAAAGKRLLVYSVKEHTFLRREGLGRVPTWLGVGREDSGQLLVTRYFEDLLKRGEVTEIITIGLAAGRFATRVFGDHRHMAMLTRTELDLSPRRPAALESFRELAAGASNLVLEDDWEMVKAIGHGSRVPHLRMPQLAVPRIGVLAAGLTAVAILYDARTDPNRTLVKELVEECHRHGVAARLVELESLYQRRDLVLGRPLELGMRYRIADCSHAVILGDSRSTAAVVAALSSHGPRVIVEATVNSTALRLHEDPGPTRGRGTALVGALRRALHEAATDHSLSTEPRVRLERLARRSSFVGRVVRRGLREWDRLRLARRNVYPAAVATSLPQWFSEAQAQSLPWFYEDLPGFDGEPSGFDVFVTVAPIENRANGARPQRIRNVVGALSGAGPTVVLLATARLLERRAEFLGWLIEQGWSPQVVYGENSTSPIHDPAVADRLVGEIERLRSHGARVGWFVRDLHWLSDEPVAEYAPGSKTAMRGLRELRAMAGVADRFFAPSASSIEEFADLLGEVHLETPDWNVLPPALEYDNVCDVQVLGEQKPGLTLVYCGGMNGFYRQDLYMDAVARLIASDEFRFDFIVRRDEVKLARAALGARGLLKRKRVRVLTTDLADYIPLTTEALGVVLLDGRYATRAFPYKTVSLLERGLRVLCYRDSGIAPFLEKYSAGVFCERDVDAICDAVRLAHAARTTLPIDELLKRESWQARIGSVREMLGSKDLTSRSR